jgi:hypothetical protein
MVVRFATTYVISAYHHQSSEFEPHSWRGVLNTTLCDKQNTVIVFVVLIFFFVLLFFSLFFCRSTFYNGVVNITNASVELSCRGAGVAIV